MATKPPLASNLGSTPVVPQYDAAGNMTFDPLAWNFWAGPAGLKYEYDEENRLTRVRIAVNDEIIAEYQYDALGRRIETLENWGAETRTRHIYEGLQAVQEYVCTADLLPEI